MKTFKQYISEDGLRDHPGPWTPYLPLPDSGGRNVVPAGSIKPPKRPVPTRVIRHDLYRGPDGELRQMPTDDYPDTQEPPPGVLRQWPGENTSQIPVSEYTLWDSGTGRGALAPWLPYPDNGGRNVVPAGSVKPPKRPTPGKISKWTAWKDYDQNGQWTGRYVSPEDIWGKSRFPYDFSQDTDVPNHSTPPTP